MNAGARAHEAHYDEVHDPALPGDDERAHGPELSEVPHPVEVRRNGGLAGLVGVLAAAVAIAWLGRATASGAVLPWLVATGTALVAAVHLRSFLDARTPLLVADTHGVRIRLGRTWRGLPWGAVLAVEHVPGRGVLRDGRLAVRPRNAERFAADLDAAGRRRAALSTRLYGAPVAVPIGLSTRVVGAGEDLVASLEALAAGAATVVALRHGAGAPAQEPEARPSRVDEEARPSRVVEEARQGRLETPADDPDTEDTPRGHDPRPWLARRIGVLAERTAQLPARLAPRRTAVEDDVEPPQDDAAPVPLVPSATPDPARGARPGTRTERTTTSVTDAPEGRELRRPGSVDLVEETVAWGDRVRPIATAGPPVAPLVLDDFAVEPADDPVVGPELAAARTRLGLTVDQLADRTRIRPHVIESIEVDDFAPCGGDFYARGHLRTLARVLGVDVAPLLTAYDERYAHAPIDARRVFEAELATTSGGSIRGTRGGPNWSVLVAAFMTVVLAWSVAQLLLDNPPEVRQPTPSLRNGSGGVGNGPVTADPVPVVVSAVRGGATVEVRDGNGETVFSGDIAYGESRTLDVVPPVQVRSDDAGVVETTVDGEDRGALGETGERGRQVYVVRD